MSKLAPVPRDFGHWHHTTGEGICVKHIGWARLSRLRLNTARFCRAICQKGRVFTRPFWQIRPPARGYRASRIVSQHDSTGSIRPAILIRAAALSHLKCGMITLRKLSGFPKCGMVALRKMIDFPKCGMATLRKMIEHHSSSISGSCRSACVECIGCEPSSSLIIKNN